MIENERIDSDEEQQAHGDELCAALTALEVANVEVCYSGSGDEGCVYAITYKNAADEYMELGDRNTKKHLEDTIGEFVCSILPDGWDINEGSSGRVTMNVAQRKLKFNHTYFVEEFKEWEEQWPTPTITP